MGLGNKCSYVSPIFIIYNGPVCSNYYTDVLFSSANSSFKITIYYLCDTYSVYCFVLSDSQFDYKLKPETTEVIRFFPHWESLFAGSIKRVIQLSRVEDVKKRKGKGISQLLIRIDSSLRRPSDEETLANKLSMRQLFAKLAWHPFVLSSPFPNNSEQNQIRIGPPQFNLNACAEIFNAEKII